MKSSSDENKEILVVTSGMIHNIPRDILYVVLDFLDDIDIIHLLNTCSECKALLRTTRQSLSVLRIPLAVRAACDAFIESWTKLSEHFTHVQILNAYTLVGKIRSLQHAQDIRECAQSTIQLILANYLCPWAIPIDHHDVESYSFLKPILAKPVRRWYSYLGRVPPSCLNHSSISLRRRIKSGCRL